MPTPTRTAAALLVLAGAAFTSHAGFVKPISTLIIEDQDIGGGALVTAINNVAINNLGEWRVEFDTNIADTDFDVLVAGPGAILLSEGIGVASPPGANIDSFDAISLNNAGEVGYNFFLDGTSGGNDDSGIYFDSELVKQESQLSGADGLSIGTPYIGFFDVKLNDAPLMLVLASVDDPNIDSTVDRALLVIDPADGAETLIAAEGGLIDGIADPIADFQTGTHDTAFNGNDDVMYIVDLSGDTAVDSIVMINDTIIAREGSPSFVDGINWDSLSSGVVDLNNNGDYVFRGTIDTDSATDTVIASNGGIFVREGDESPGGFAFTSFGTGPVQIADSGDIAWYGDWNDPDTDVDTGLFINDELIVQEGVTTIEGLVVDSISATEDGFQFSDNGQFLIFEATLEGGLNGAFLYQVITPLECPGDTNGDNMVDSADLNNILGAFGDANDEFDLTGDGQIDSADLNEVLGAFGTFCPIF